MDLERGTAFLSKIADTRHDLPYSPSLLQRLFAQTKDGSLASLGQIAETISPDQGLTARLLAVANSAFYGLQSQVTSVQRAATVLGIKEIRTIVLALGVHGLTKGHQLPEDFDLVAYWTHQLSVAQTARLMAKGLAAVDTDNIFTSGLLHDLGKMLIAMHAPKDWVSIGYLRAQKNLPHFKAEDEWWGVEHGVVGALVLRSWNLPAELHEPVNWHHAPLAAPEYRTEAKLLCLADLVVNETMQTAPVNPKAVEALCASLELAAKQARAMALQAVGDEGLAHFISEVLRAA